jgi:hypothetical protein
LIAFFFPLPSHEMKIPPVLFCVFSLLAPALYAQVSPLRAGAAAVDITPREFPLNMPGGFSANLAESAHDPLHSRALVLDGGSVRLALAVVDTLGAGPEVLDEIKQRRIGQHKQNDATEKRYHGPEHNFKL